ncbi:MAG: competence/damage-inducible protein A [Salinivenus sp.]
MRAQLLTVGDELLIGQTTNTNAAWLGEELSQMGVAVDRTVTVGDAEERIRAELDRAYQRARLVIVTGGLGPTHDDLTREAVASYFDAPLQTDDEILSRIRRYYEHRNRQMPSAATKLAQVPTGFEVLNNPVGAAVGLWYEEAGRLLAVLPGIPEEMKGIFRAEVRPRLATRDSLQERVHRTLVTSGIAESSLQERLGVLDDMLDAHTDLAYLPSTSGVRLRLTASTDGVQDPATRLDRLEAYIRERVGEHVIGTGEVTLEEVLGDQLRSGQLTIATAESATGGLIGHRLTAVGGASKYYVGSVVAYANRVKQRVLNVTDDALEQFGAVSEAVAVQMAEGVRRALDADVAIATTGIAGPTGGTPEKPVGTVWLGYADAHQSRAVRRQFVEDRTLNKKLFASAALDLARREVKNRENEGSSQSAPSRIESRSQ